MIRFRSPNARRLLGAIAVAVLAAAIFGRQIIGVRLGAQTGNPIPAENLLPGNPKSEWDVSGSGDATIQGFATDISVNKGGTVSFKVTTTAASFSINIYRLGYYQGNGARKVATISGVTGKSQTACLNDSATGLYDCGNWTVSTSWTIPATAVSGIYIARLIRADNGGASHIPFIVRDDALKSDVLLQTGDTTWQAYNQYGGRSTYLGAPAAASKVSYNRPFATRGQTSGYGTSNYVFYAEYPMVRWLESNGYNVKYWTGVDADRFGSALTGAAKPKVLLTVGHDEYWSGGERNAVEAARNAGVHLAFFTGNEMFWKTRYEPSIDGTATPYRTLVTYKDTKANAPVDPIAWTGTWRDPRFTPPADAGRPENSLDGQLFTVNRGSAAITVPGTFAPLRFWRNTAIAALASNQSLSLAIDTLGYEWDEDLDDGSRPAGSIQLSSTVVSVPERIQDFGSIYSSGTATHHLSLYRHSSGALVFGAGTVQWVWGLDTNHDTSPDAGSSTADPNMRQATINLLADMGAQPATIQSGMVVASASTDLTPPSSTIASPVAGASIAAGTVVTISGTASDAGGGVVGGVDVSVDGGSTWRRATGKTNWSFAWAPGVLGNATIMSRATDDSANLEQPTLSTTVTILQANCPCSIWTPSLATPWAADGGDANSTEVGLKFQSDVGGIVNGVRFYKAPANTGTHIGHLWTRGGTLLASVTFTGESASGWQQATFASQVVIQPATTYVISYLAPAGHYADNQYYLGRAGVDQWPLHALKDGVDGPNGLFSYSSTSTFPTGTWFSDNYWVDVVFTPDLIPPTVALTAPANGANISGNAVAVSASASDSNGIAGVQFKLDGVILGAEDTVSPYSITWNSTLAFNSAHTLTAVARDTAGNLTTTAPITVNVFNVDTVPPTVSITSPTNGAAAAGIVSVTASATDNQGVAGVQFLLDGASYGAEKTIPPYTVSWDVTGLPNNSTHTVAARARDASNNVTTSAANTVIIANPVPGAPVMDAFVWTDQTVVQSSTLSPAFSTTSPNELLLAFVATDYVSGTNTTVTGVTGAGLTWVLVARTNVQAGTSEIWRAFAPSPLTNVSATATLSQPVISSLTIVTFSNVDTSGVNGSGAIGAVMSANAASGAPTATLTTTRNNSWVFGVGTDYDNAIARTAGTAQILMRQYLTPVGDTYWAQRMANPTSSSGTSVTINDTAPTGDRYNLTICEVLPPPPAAVPPVITSPTTASGSTGAAFSYQIAASNSPASFGATGLPAGLSVNSANGLISGTPTAAGTSTVTLSATNSSGTGTATLTLTIAVPPPVITSAATAAGIVGAAFSYQIAASNSPTSYGAAGLPAGLSVNSGTGLISGTPTAAGTSSVTLSAINGSGTGTKTLTVTIAVPPPVITSGATAAGTAGTGFTYQITATNGPTSYGAAGLPAGLSVNSGNGLISGTPTAAGTSSVTLSATNSSGTGTAPLTLTIATAPPAVTSSATAVGAVGAAFTYQITATNAPTSYGATGLPAGLSVNGATGLVSGTPTAAGTSSVTVSATNSGGTGTATLTLTIAVGPPSITSAATAAGTVGTAFTYQITATNTPTGYSATGLPAGLSVNNASGLISGTPTAPGTSTVTLGATNGAGTGSATLTLTVAQAPPSITSATTSAGTVGAAFTYQITATNGPTSYSAVGLPAGLSADSGTGLISGTPTAAGTSTVALGATNSAGSGTATLTLTIAPPPPGITSATTATGAVGVPFGYQITATNAPTSYGATGLPAGVSINPVSGAISGTPTTAGTSTVTLSATNAGGTGTATLTLSIAPAPPVITSGTTSSGTVGVSFVYQITASNTPTSYGATGLPAGVSVNTASGAISGTPTTAGTSTVALSATNAGGTGTATLTLTVTASPPPTVVSTTPTSGATGVGTASTVTATFSQAINSTTLTTSNLVLRDPSNAIVTATVTYNSATFVATLTPSQSLAASTTYTATIIGGSTGVKDTAGNALASNYVWSFTTTSPVSIWSPSAVPAAFATSDGSSVELGVKFRSDVAGNITGVRFYKGSTTTGTHTGTLWSSTGTKLATATFTSETASGWQQVTFAPAVAITANTIYVMSYHTNVGNYAYSPAYFASTGVDNGPLHALATGVSPDGVYQYGASAFPTSTYNANNYWVDVVFVQR